MHMYNEYILQNTFYMKDPIETIDYRKYPIVSIVF